MKEAQKRLRWPWTHFLVLQFTSTMTLGGKNNNVNTNINRISITYTK